MWTELYPFVVFFSFISDPKESSILVQNTGTSNLTVQIVAPSSIKTSTNRLVLNKQQNKEVCVMLFFPLNQQKLLVLMFWHCECFNFWTWTASCVYLFIYIYFLGVVLSITWFSVAWPRTNMAKSINNLISRP